MVKSSDAAGRADGTYFRTGLHPMSGASALSLAAFIAFIGTLIIRHNDLPAATDVRIAAVCLLLGAAALLGPFLRWRRSAVEVLPGELRLTLGTWRPRTIGMALREIESVDVRSGAVGRQLDYGTLTIAATDDTAIVVHHVRAPLAVRDALRRVGGRR
jgi:hypothetical protein